MEKRWIYQLWREEKPLDHIKDKPFAIIVCGIFLLTIIAMALRPIFGYHLGFIAMGGAITLILVFEVFKRSFTLEMASVEQIFSELDWRAIFFYVSLFALVGGLEHSGVIKLIANWITPFIQIKSPCRKHLALLGDCTYRGNCRTRCLHPYHALCDQRHRQGTWDKPLAPLLVSPMGGHIGKQPDHCRGSSFICG